MHLITQNEYRWDSACSLNLHPNKYSQELYYYPFAVKLDRCVEVVILLITY